jgi:hypothetical protein
MDGWIGLFCEFQSNRERTNQQTQPNKRQDANGNEAKSPSTSHYRPKPTHSQPEDINEQQQWQETKTQTIGSSFQTIPVEFKEG